MRIRYSRLQTKQFVPVEFHYRLTFLGFLAVLAACLKFLAVGAPFSPTFLIRSPLPALILARFLCMLSYSPFVAITILPYQLLFFLSILIFCLAVTVIAVVSFCDLSRSWLLTLRAFLGRGFLCCHG